MGTHIHVINLKPYGSSYSGQVLEAGRKALIKLCEKRYADAHKHRTIRRDWQINLRSDSLMQNDESMNAIVIDEGEIVRVQPGTSNNVIITNLYSPSTTSKIRTVTQKEINQIPNRILTGEAKWLVDLQDVYKDYARQMDYKYFDDSQLPPGLKNICCHFEKKDIHNCLSSLGAVQTTELQSHVFFPFIKQAVDASVLSIKAELLNSNENLVEFEHQLRYYDEYFRPNQIEHESYITSEVIANVIQNWLFSCDYKDQIRMTKMLNDDSDELWETITEHSYYAVPSQGRAEVLLPDGLSARSRIRSLRFIKERTIGREVYIRIKTEPFIINSLKKGSEPTELPKDIQYYIGYLKVNNNGLVEGFHNCLGSSNIYCSFIRWLCLNVYRDLVCPAYPDDVYESRNYNFSDKNPKSSLLSKGIPNRINPRMLPRQRKMQNPSLDDWQDISLRLLHSVVGHMRRFQNPFQIASYEKQLEAKQAGINLPIGYTWVKEHFRGGENDIIPIKNNELLHRISFTTSQRFKVKAKMLEV